MMYYYVYVIVETRTIRRVDVRAESRLEDGGKKKKTKQENGRLRVNVFLARGDLVRAVPVRDARPGTSSAPR